MHKISRFTVPGKPGILVLIASLIVLSSLASPAFAASQERNSQFSMGMWKIVHSPGEGGLSAIAVVSASDIWAVGGSTTGTLIEQWNGTAWFIVPSPSPDASSLLDSVAIVSPNDIWAVGQEYLPGSNTNVTLIENWNGSNWSVVASPNPVSNSYLNGVAVVSATDIWAVGYTFTQQGGTQTLIEQWNGSSWAVISSPSPGNSSELSSVAVVSAHDVWAVGSNTNGPLTENWNGSSWNVVNSPRSGYSYLSSVAAVSASDIWAVGTNNAKIRAKTFTEHWNGSTWTIVSSPNQPSGPVGNGLQSVAVVSNNSVWAVGYYGTGNAFTNPLIEYWNGTKWKIVSSPSQGDYNSLAGVVSVPGTGHLWAVGYHAFVQGPNHTFTEYYG